MPRAFVLCAHEIEKNAHCKRQDDENVRAPKLSGEEAPDQPNAGQILVVGPVLGQ